MENERHSEHKEDISAVAGLKVEGVQTGNWEKEMNSANNQRSLEGAQNFPPNFQINTRPTDTLTVASWDPSNMLDLLPGGKWDSKQVLQTMKGAAMLL